MMYDTSPHRISVRFLVVGFMAQVSAVSGRKDGSFSVLPDSESNSRFVGGCDRLSKCS